MKLKKYNYFLKKTQANPGESPKHVLIFQITTC